MAYNKTNWQSLPSTDTPISAGNLNKIENGIYDNSLKADQVGDLTQLATTEKSTLVGAINENNSQITSLNTYSTTEQVIGTWINDKPIYRKVITGINTPSSTNTWVSISSISNVDTLINMYGFITSSDSRKLTLNHSEPSAEISTTFKNGNIEMKITIDSWKNRSCYLVVEYTKTTD